MCLSIAEPLFLCTHIQFHFLLPPAEIHIATSAIWYLESNLLLFPHATVTVDFHGKSKEIYIMTSNIILWIPEGHEGRAGLCLYELFIPESPRESSLFTWLFPFKLASFVATWKETSLKSTGSNLGFISLSRACPITTSIGILKNSLPN